MRLQVLGRDFLMTVRTKKDIPVVRYIFQIFPRAGDPGLHPTDATGMTRINWGADRRTDTAIGGVVFTAN